MTRETLLKPVPYTFTVLPRRPEPGLKLVIVGGTVTVNELELTAVPAGATTVIFPEVAPAGTVAWMVDADTTVKDVALTPLNCTAVAPVNSEPLIVTTVPTGPVDGEMPLMRGAVTVKLFGLSAVPDGVRTTIFPVCAPAGTVTVIDEPDTTVYDGAFTPLNDTDVAPVRFEPEMVTSVPTGPDEGETLLMLGGCVTGVDEVGASGIERNREVVRAKIALPTAGAIGGRPGSPIPPRAAPLSMITVLMATGASRILIMR